MEIYWSKKDIPEWSEMSEPERQAAIQAITRKVWRHWQVYLPFAIQISMFWAFFIWGPRFEYNILVVGVIAYLTAKIAGLPFHSYLRKYLIEYRSSMQNIREIENL